MFLTKLRKQYEKKSVILGKYLSKLSPNPDIFTLFGTGCGLIAGVLLWHSAFVPAVGFIVLSGLGDMADGAVARFLQKQHPFGTVFDRVNDRYVEFFIAVGCIGSGRVHPAWAIFAVFGAVMASYTRACAESVGKVKTCAVGLMERQEKAFLLTVGILLEPFFNPNGLPASGLHPFPYPLKEGVLILQFLLILVGLFSHLTVYQRLRYARRHENEI